MKKIFSTCMFIIPVLFLSCADVLEDDITNDQVTVIYPTQGVVVEGSTTQFSWYAIDGADDYHLQILRENQTTVVDSVIQNTLFNYNLNPGVYKWRIKAENFAYTTQYNFPIDFFVEYSNDLSNEILVLSTPSNGMYTNDTNILLTWEALAAAEYYDLMLIKNLNGQETILQETNLTSTSYYLNSNLFDEDAEYIWKVKAVNSISETNYSEYSFFIDRQVPNQPILSSPSDFEIVQAVVNFNWINGVDTGNIQSLITNTLDISTDPSFSVIIESVNIENNSYQYTFNNTGTFYWRVRATDLADNESEYSIIRSITVE